ncbi:MAG TPA: response regulator [Terriglobales bacterium]|nr:response regulator [Terriglobales bacterium]
MSAPTIAPALVPPAAGSLADTAPATTSKQPIRIFLVEDNEDDAVLFRHLLASSLPEMPVHLAHAPAIAPALEQLQQASYDVLFLDYQLGAGTGLELLGELRRRGVETPAVFLTGHGDEQVAVQAMKSGACDYLSKGKLDSTSLKRTLRFVVSLHEHQSRLKQAQAELRLREERFRALVENAFDATVLMNGQGTILWASNSSQRVLGLSPQQLIGSDGLELLDGDQPGAAQQVWDDLLRRPAAPVQLAFRHKNNEWRDIEGVGSNWLGQSAVGAIVFNFRDVTERRRAEEKLRKLFSAVEQAADGVVITDCEGSIQYVNPAFETLTGYPREEVLGRNPRLLKSGMQDGHFYQDMWAAILRGEVFRGVLINRKKSGELYYAEKTITPVRDPTGRITHFISNDRDITERRKLEEQLAQVQKMDAIGQLAGGVAHDFNNLLMVISSYAELMLDATAADSPLRHHGEEILKAARRAADLTRQLLTFSRKQLQALRVLNLNSVLQEICRTLPRLIGEDIQLSFKPGQDLWPVKADPVQLEQIVMNLATNARDAMPHGGQLSIETGNIELDEAYCRTHPEATPGEYVQLTVSDCGVGIEPAILPHIFEPFFTTKEKGKGTGLGLATIYGIVKQSAGHITVRSEKGTGTTFQVFLPRATAAAADSYRSARSGQALAGQETVLLVEDEQAVRDSEREYLERQGYTVIVAANGAEALEQAHSCGRTIHLLVTDVVMPKMSGGELGQKLAAQMPHLKVLYVSGYAENTVLQHGLAELGSCFLQKPFTLKALAAKIREVLESEP